MFFEHDISNPVHTLKFSKAPKQRVQRPTSSSTICYLLFAFPYLSPQRQLKLTINIPPELPLYPPQGTISLKLGPQVKTDRIIDLFTDHRIHENLRDPIWPLLPNWDSLQRLDYRCKKLAPVSLPGGVWGEIFSSTTWP